MTRAKPIGGGAVVTLFVGILGSIFPFVGAIVGAGLGGFLAGTWSDEEEQLQNGGLAGLIGGVLPAFAAFVSLSYYSNMSGLSTELSGGKMISIASGVVPQALGFAVVLGVVGVITSRYGNMNPMAGAA